MVVQAFSIFESGRTQYGKFLVMLLWQKNLAATVIVLNEANSTSNVLGRTNNNPVDYNSREPGALDKAHLTKVW